MNLPNDQRMLSSIRNDIELSESENDPSIPARRMNRYRKCLEARQRKKLVEEIRHQKASGIKTQQSLALLQKAHSDLHITLKDLQNERSRLRQEAMKHHTPAEACLNLLDKLNFYKDFEVGEDNRSEVMIGQWRLEATADEDQ
jgi:predicted transcriptional regulator